MTQRITAIVENGILRPTSPLGLPDGARVEVTILNPTEAAGEPQQSRSVKDLVKQIIDLPIESTDPDPNTSRDHDHYLYGTPRRP